MDSREAEDLSCFSLSHVLGEHGDTRDAGMELEAPVYFPGAKPAKRPPLEVLQYESIWAPGQRGLVLDTQPAPNTQPLSYFPLRE